MYGFSKWLTCRIWPLVGGIILDWVGVDVVAPICTTTILVGSLVAASGVQIGNWRVLAGGYILQGFGTALLDSCQQVFFHAFGRRQGLAFAFGLENAIASATSLASEAAAITQLRISILCETKDAGPVSRFDR
jgi:hypothetical protein